jgi:hypothetical protein
MSNDLKGSFRHLHYTMTASLQSNRVRLRSDGLSV